MKITVEAESKEISEVISAMKNPAKTSYMAEAFRNILTSYEPKNKDNRHFENNAITPYKTQTTIETTNKK